MKLFDPDPQLRWLFCMCHPDDEISICCWIRRLVQLGAEVYMSWTHHTEVRAREARYVAKWLGVAETHLFFHNGRDGRICEEMPDLVQGYQEMVRAVRPDVIACGAFEQGHLDHDATNLLVNRVFSGRVLEIPFYHTYLNRRPLVNRFADSTGEEILELTEDEQCFKVKFAKSYPSQAIYRNLVLDEIRRRIMRNPDRPLKATERMRHQTHFDYLTPNLPPRLAAKVVKSENWQRWQRAVRDFA